jgi:LDH2 family malate/lactate/ureidoglycolate dehydrogenase
MLPLGGGADTAGYKGYGLASAVDVLTGVLGGGTFGLDVTGMWDTGLPTTSSQLHIAIDPGVVGEPDRFARRLGAWRDQVTSRARAEGVEEILVAGDLEWRATERQAERLELLPEVRRDLAAIAVERRLLRRWRDVVGR